MKILYFYQYFGTPKGGWSTRVYEFTKRWVQEGHEVQVITSPYDKSDIQGQKKGLYFTQVIDGIEVTTINIKQSNKHSKLRRIYTFLSYSIISVYFAMTAKADVVVSSSGPITVGIPGMFARYFRRKPLVFEVRDLWPEGAIQLNLIKNSFVQRLAYWFEKCCYRASSAIVTCSPGMTEEIRRKYKKIPFIYEIPNSSDNDLFSEGNPLLVVIEKTRNKQIVIYTGSLGLMDGCMQIVKAARELHLKKRDDILIVIAGEGTDKIKMEKFCQANHLKNVLFLGLIPKNEVKDWLALAKAAILVFKDIPILNTSSPNKLFDYLAAGKPVIQTTNGWIKSLVDDFEFGMNVPVDHPVAMANAIEAILSDDFILQQMSDNALLTAKNIFDRYKLSLNYLHIIESVYYGKQPSPDRVFRLHRPHPDQSTC